MSSGTEAIDRKQRIRDRYRGVDTSDLEVILKLTRRDLKSRALTYLVAWCSMLAQQSKTENSSLLVAAS